MERFAPSRARTDTLFHVELPMKGAGYTTLEWPV